MIAQRAQKVQASPIRKLVPYAHKAKAQGKIIYHLNIGQPDLPTPTPFWETLKNLNTTLLDYTESAGMPAFRRAYAAFYTERYGIPLSENDILVTTGGSEALLFAFLTLFNPGDEVLTIEPTYANYISLGGATGITLRGILTSAEKAFALPTTEEIASQLTPKTRGILICNPSNPTGKLYTQQDLQAIAHLCQEHGLFLISDEAYRDYHFDGSTYFSALQLPHMEEKVVVIDTLSKRFSACGARIGALITRNPHIQQAALKWAQARLSPPSLGQMGGMALFQLPPSYYEELRQEYQNRRDILLKALQAIPGVLCPSTEGAFYLMPKLPLIDSDHFAQWLLEGFDKNGYTLMVAPGTGFFTDPEKGRAYVRIAYVLQANKLQHAAEIFAEALTQYQAQFPQWVLSSA
ncbi:MAG: pyridoxal phosphate-dependent aminotransferase [Bacteroidia bacterium]